MVSVAARLPLNPLEMSRVRIGNGGLCSLQQRSRRVLKCRPIPDQRLVGEAESHDPIPLDAANCDPQKIGQLMQGVHAPGHGRGPGVEATVDQLTHWWSPWGDTP